MAILLIFASLANHAKENAMKTVFTLMLIGAIALLSACNTVKGMGQDLQKAGEKIENSVKK
jgi:predicted small secreted protein